MAEFKNTELILNLRSKYVDKNGVLMQDVEFESASAAASFVAGYSANGLIAWHVEKHVRLKDALGK
mgnify:CR=1 FL=1